VYIEISGMKKDHKIFRENMYCSMNDIAVDTIKELPEIIGLVTGNYFEKISLIGITIDISITNTIKCGRIEEVKLNKKTYAPGDIMEANVKIRTFRKGVIDKKVILEIPSSMPESEAVLTIRGGGEADHFSDENNQNYHHESALNLKEAIENISGRPLNNQLVAEIIFYHNDALWDGDFAQNDLKSEDKITSQIKIDTEMVIQGYKEIPFSIIP
jgi:hypothetical protein